MAPDHSSYLILRDCRGESNIIYTEFQFVEHGRHKLEPWPQNTETKQAKTHGKKTSNSNSKRATTMESDSGKEVAWRRSGLLLFLFRLCSIPSVPAAAFEHLPRSTDAVAPLARLHFASVPLFRCFTNCIPCVSCTRHPAKEQTER